MVALFPTREGFASAAGAGMTQGGPRAGALASPVPQ